MKRPSILNRLPLLLTLVVAIAAPLHAQEGKIDISFLDFSKVAAETVDVTLEGQMLRLASKFLASDPDDKDAASVVRGLTGIYVKSYTFDAKATYSSADIDRIRMQLGAGWSRIVTAKSRNGEDTEIWLLSKNDRVAGMVIVAAEPDELTVVNLVGDVDLDKLGKLEGQFGIPSNLSGEKAKEAKP